MAKDSAPPTVAIGRRALLAATKKTPSLDLPVVPRETYEIQDELARGGLGRILRARDTRTDRIVAIKENLEDDGEAAARRFAREALITANLQHPAIVPVYELGRWPSNEPFYAMKLVSGRSFEAVIRDEDTLAGRLARLPVVVAVADALAYAHGCQVIHRDLKPANVLVGDFGETVVIDWGLAKVIGTDDDHPAPIPTAAASNHTVAGSVLGTPGYMAPEQARGEPADARTDVYAIGAMLYQLISGHAPFLDRTSASLRDAARPGEAGPCDTEIKDAHSLIAAVATDSPTPIAKLQPEAPPDLVTIVEKAMARDVAARYRSAGELADDLRRFTTGQLVRAHHYDWRTLLGRWARRNRTALAVAGALGIALVVLAVASVVRIVDERAQARREAERARTALATALLQKGRDAEAAQQWTRAATFYAASRVQHDTPDARWAAGLAEARAVVPLAIHDHGVPVHGVAISPDGKRVASVDAAGRVQLWTIAGDAIASADISSLGLYAVAFSPDGRELAVAGDAGTIVRLAPDLARIGELRGHAGRVWSIAYAADGAHLASAGEDASARYWTLADGSSRELRAHTQRVYDVAFSPDGKTLVTASDDRRALAWDLASDAAPETVATHTSGGIVVARFMPTGEIVTAGWDWTVQLRHTDGQTEPWQEDHNVRGAAIALGGRVLLTGGDSGTISAWTLPAHRLITTLPMRGPLTAAAASPDGTVLVTGSDTGKAIAWDLRPLARLADAVGHAEGVNAVQLARDGAITGSRDHTLRSWELPSGRERLRIVTSELCNEGIAAVGDDIVAACKDSTIRRWDSTGREVAKLTTPVWLRYVAASPDGKTLYAGHLKGVLYTIDVATWTITGEMQAHDHQIYDVIARADGRVVTASLDDHVKVWRDRNLEYDVKLGTDDGVLTADLSPDATQLAAGTQDGRVVVRDLAHDRWIVKAAGAQPMTSLGAIHYLRYAPDGKHAYTVGDDGVRAWDTSTWEGSRLLDAGGGGAIEVAITRDGHYLVAGYSSGGILVWDLVADRLARRIGGDAHHGSCADVDATAWVDDGERQIVGAACAADATRYDEQLAHRTRQKLTGVDVGWEWER